MFSWFKKNKTVHRAALRADMHSHLLPGLDDGVATLEEACDIIAGFVSLGYTHLVTTPHVMSDAYRNTPEGIGQKLQELRDFISQKGIEIRISAAAEYYLDEALFRMVETNTPLLTFGSRYLLFETNFITEPFNLKEFIFMATTKGYKLVLAHPERYLYLQDNFEKVQDLLDRGVLMQMNVSSLTGYYSKSVRKMAFGLINRKMIHWLGSDCHHMQHMQLMRNAQALRYFRKALDLPLLNNSLT